MNCMNAQQFISRVKAGDHVDVRDCEGDWFEAKIVSILRCKTVAKCHFINYSKKWDCNISLNPANIAHQNKHSKSTGINCN